MMHCRKTKDCTYSAIKLALLEQHEDSCNKSLVALEQAALDSPTLTCDHPECIY